MNAGPRHAGGAAQQHSLQRRAGQRRPPAWTLVLVLALAGLAAAGGAAQAAGDAAGSAGDIARGAAIVASRSQGLCVLCHAVPGQPPHLQGDIGPPLAGVGARLDSAALRQRLLAPQRFNPDTVMPAYGNTQGLQRVAGTRSGRPLLQPAQIDDVVAYLASLL